MKQPEYREGPEALESFKQLATAILQAPAKKKKRQVPKGQLTCSRAGVGFKVLIRDAVTSQVS